jgi:hypothetical protein
VVLGTLAAVVGATFTPLLPAQHAGAVWQPCDNYNSTNYSAKWESRDSGTSKWEGVAATYMSFTPGHLCTQTPNGPDYSDAIVQIKSSNGGYALAGHIVELGGPCWRFFAQQKQDSAHATTTIYGVCIANQYERHNAWDQTVYTPGAHIRSNIDTTIFIESPWSPYGSWVNPWNVTWAGSTSMNRSDIPGYDTAETDFSGMQVQSNMDAHWYSSCADYLYWYFDNRYYLGDSACDHTWVYTSQP